MKVLKSLFFIAVGIVIATSFPEQSMEYVEAAKNFDYAQGFSDLVQSGKDGIDFVASQFGGAPVEAAGSTVEAASSTATATN